MESEFENMNAILEEVRNAPSLGDVQQICEKYLPGWLMSVLPAYSSDYPTLTQNHQRICQHLGVFPQGIVLVRDFNTEQKLPLFFADLMARAGFVVRRHTEFTKCANCELAIPTYPVYLLLKNNKSVIPDIWRDHCQKC